MVNDPRISELLVATKAFKDLDKPVILTSGELGIYYINTEKLAQDSGEFEKYGDDPQAMIAHAIKMTRDHPTFGEVIDILTQDAERLTTESNTSYAISGGQRRDWLFSGPVAHNLSLPHVSLYKEGNLELLGPNGVPYALNTIKDRGFVAIHFVDLLTEASSYYRLDQGKPAGWIPMLRTFDFKINDLVSVVTRLQGGEQRLKEQDVNVEAKVAIDESFLRDHSNQPKVSVPYNQNPTAWSQGYLMEYGALTLLDTFNPTGGKLDRAKKFLTRYRTTLDEAARFDELKQAVFEKYDTDINSLIGAPKL